MILIQFYKFQIEVLDIKYEIFYIK